jgi:transmembrane sensor
MSQLKFPLKEGLRDPADEGAVSRMWQGIDSRFPRRRPGRSVMTFLAPGVVLAAAAGVALVAYVRHDPGPLRLANGGAIAAVDAPPAGAHVAMSDGSSIELSAGARFEPIESSAASFIGVLERGTATFDVQHGGGRRWQIECGLATTMRHCAYRTCRAWKGEQGKGEIASVPRHSKLQCEAHDEAMGLDVTGSGAAFGATAR